MAVSLSLYFFLSLSFSQCSTVEAYKNLFYAICIQASKIQRVYAMDRIDVCSLSLIFQPPNAHGLYTSSTLLMNIYFHFVCVVR